MDYEYFYLYYNMDIQKLIPDNEPKRFIYFPSLSAGGVASAFKKNTQIDPGLTARFYHPDFPQEWRHPYFLVTAGHFYKKMETRKDFALEDTFVFGDSGGYQIATGAIKWDHAIREKIFHWLEANSDIAANLDIPPKTVYEGKFDESFQISYDNFKWFETHQSGKTKFLNVLQGSNPAEYTFWYHKVIDFQFNGWCVGGPQKLVDFMFTIAIFLKNREFEKLNIKFIHMLGISKVSDFFILSMYQSLLNKHFGNRIIISTDSSSPGQYPIYGDLIYGAIFKDLSFTQLYFSRDRKYHPELRLPARYHSPVMKNFKYNSVIEFKQEWYNRATLQNVFVFNSIINEANELVDSGLELLETVIPKDLHVVLTSMKEMFESDDPHLVYEKYRQYYAKFGGNGLVTYSKSALDNFFEFN